MNCSQIVKNTDSSIRDYLNEEQITQIISIINSRCENYEKVDYAEREKFNIPKDTYDMICKGRKAHILTLGLYLDLYNTKDKLIGFQLILTENGNYYQPELFNDEVIIHIYHKSSMDSKLIKVRAKEDKPFFCIQFDVDKINKLKSIDSMFIYKDGSKGSPEKLYSARKCTDKL